MNKLEIRGARARKGLTQKDVAEAIGITQATYSQKETGHTRFTDVEKISLARLFGWNYSEMNKYLYDGLLPEDNSSIEEG